MAAAATTGPPPARAALRAGLGALGVILLSGTPMQGPMASFALGLPFVAAIAAWLAWTIRPRPGPLGPAVAAVLVFCPAAGHRATMAGIEAFDARYLVAEDALVSILAMASHVPRGTGPLLAAASLALILGFGRWAAPMAGAGLLGGLGALLGRLLLQDARDSLELGRYSRAAWEAWLAGWMGWLAIAGVGLGLLLLPRRREAPEVRLRRVPALLWLLCTLVAGWAASPPVGLLARTWVAPAPRGEVMRAPPDRATTAPVIDLPLLPFEAGPWHQALDAAGFPQLRRWRVPCEDLPPFDWAGNRSNAVALALPPETRLSALAPVIPLLLEHGVRELSLLGRAPPQPGPYGALARWSAVTVRLQHPPSGALWLLADRHGWQRLEASPWYGSELAVCGLTVEDDMRLDAFVRQLRDLSSPGRGGPCVDALSLVRLPGLPTLPDGPMRCDTASPHL